MPVVAPDLPQAEAAIVAMTNAFRIENKLGPVAPNAALQAAAQAFADYLARTGAFSHTADGHPPLERAKAAGYKPCFIAENIAMRQVGPESEQGLAAAGLARRIIEGWMASAPHRVNLLTAGATDVGIGIALSGDAVPKIIAVQVLGSPASFEYSFTIENKSGHDVAYRLNAAARTLAIGSTHRQTACAQRLLSFTGGAVTSSFLTKSGDRFVVTRGADGAPHVERVNSHP